MYHYFPFTIISDFTGNYTHYSSTSFNIPNGNISQPADILKFNAGINTWSQLPESHYFLNNEIEIKSLSGTDWTINLKNLWFDDYLKYINLSSYISPSERTTLFNYINTLNIYESLSSPSIAYVTRHDGTNGLIIDPYLTNEVSIGLNVYDNPYIRDYALQLPINDLLRNKIFTYHRSGEIFISNLCKVKYQGYENIVWCFDGIEYKDYNITNIGLTPSLSNGGGNVFGEVKLAGNHIQAHYIVKKNVKQNDPTFGLCSGEGKPFCFGDEIVLIDTTCFTSNGSNGWTWIGNYSDINFIWNIADITHPCTYFRDVEIFSQIFPLRVIQFCEFNNFN